MGAFWNINLEYDVGLISIHLLKIHQRVYLRSKHFSLQIISLFRHFEILVQILSLPPIQEKQIRKMKRPSKNREKAGEGRTCGLIYITGTLSWLGLHQHDTK